MDAPYSMLEQVEPGVARLLARNPSPFTFTGTQTYLVGEEELVVIDPGPPMDEHVAAIVAAAGGRTIAASLKAAEAGLRHAERELERIERKNRR